MAETPVQTIPKMSKISEISDKIENWAKYIHAKNGLKTVLGRSGAEIIDFLCFDHLYMYVFDHIGPILDRGFGPEFR